MTAIAPPRPPELSPFSQPVQQQPDFLDRYGPYLFVGAIVAGVGYYVYTVASGSTFGDSLAKSLAGFGSDFTKKTLDEVPALASKLTDVSVQTVDTLIEKVIDPASEDWSKGVEAWKQLSYGRGVGSIPWTGSCEGGKEKDAGLCYAKCKYGYHGVGPTCWNDKPGVVYHDKEGGYSPQELLEINNRKSGKGLKRLAVVGGIAAAGAALSR